MDALLPLASLPAPFSGRNHMGCRIVIDAIRTDSGWKTGDYTRQPRDLRTAAQMLSFMPGNPLMWQETGPTLKAADEAFDREVNRRIRTMDANDISYAVDALWDHDPGTGLEKIKAPLLAINLADDLINPPELGILEREIKRFPPAAAPSRSPPAPTPSAVAPTPRPSSGSDIWRRF